MKKIVVGITIGDINGIGLEVILKAISDSRLLDFCVPVIYGSTKIVSYHKNIVKTNEIPFNTIRDVEQADEEAINVVNCWNENVRITLGRVTKEGGHYAWTSLQRAVVDWKEQKIDALLTAPIHKKAMELCGFEFPGHTEYLTKEAGAEESLMLMVHEKLRIGLVTNHVPISQVANLVTPERIERKVNIMNETLKRDFGINQPKIAVLGLNPHASDGGAIGNEDLEIVQPTIQAIKEKGIKVWGPYAADGFFGSGNYLNFDGILAMYHDQGLAPFKTLSFGGGINYTAGLPFIRTSPDHGTGMDIAGQNIASPDSFMKALFLGIDIVRQRANFDEMHANPLKEVTAEQQEELANEERQQGGKQGRGNKGRQQRQQKHPKPKKKEQREEKVPQNEKNGQDEQTPKENAPEPTTEKPMSKVEEKVPNVERKEEKAVVKEEQKTTSVQPPVTEKVEQEQENTEEK